MKTWSSVSDTPLGIANYLETYGSLCAAVVIYELSLLLETHAVAFGKPQWILSITRDYLRAWLRELQLGIRPGRKAAFTIICHKHRRTSIEWQ
jgi:hypothetical protein